MGYHMPTNPKANLQLIYVTNINRSTKFYELLFNAQPIFSSPRYVAFDAGDQNLFAIWTGGTTPDITAPRFSEIGIMLPTDQEVDDLFVKWKEKPEITILQKPQTEVFGRTFLVQDPDGHIIRVCSRD